MSILRNNALDFISNQVKQTDSIGIRLGELIKVGDVICLYGDLGSGKTALARGIGRGWGTAARITSPTYTLVNQYPRVKDNAILYHIDCYRLQETADIVTSGIADILDSPGAFLIEWPECIEPLLPADRLNIQMRYVNEFKRGILFEADGGRSEKMLEAFRRSAFGI